MRINVTPSACVALYYDNGACETLSASDVVRVRYLHGVDCTAIPSDSSGGDGWDMTVAELLVELCSEPTPAKQRNWWQILNDDDDTWTVIDHVATRQLAPVDN